MGWIGQTGYYPANFNMNIDPYGSMSYMSSGVSTSATSSSDSSNSFSGNIRDIEKKRKSELNKYYKKKEAENLKVSLNSDEIESFYEYDTKRNRKQKIAEQGSLFGTLGMTALFTAGPIVRACKIKQNNEVKNIFFKYNELKKDAKYSKLYKQAPITMQEAQEEMTKAYRQYQKRLKNLEKYGNNTNKLKKDYKDLQNIMIKALDKNNADEIAEATARIRAANGTKYKNLLNGQSKFKLAKSADVTNVKAITGNKLKHHVGGKFGVVMLLLSPVMIMLGDKDKIKTAFEKDTKTGLKQTGISLLKGVASGGAYFFADAFSKKFIASALSKGAGKIAAKAAGKLATKGIGKILGTALGSLIPIPGINLIAGALIGAAIDLGIRKLTACITEPAEKIEQKKKTKEKLFTDAYIDKMNGVELDKTIEKAFKKNKAYCAHINEELLKQQEQAQQGQQVAVA